MRPTKNLIGHIFGKLKVLEKSNTPPPTKWICQCNCGNKTTVLANSLQRNKTKSCGCSIGKSAKARFTTHGLSATPEYTAWKDMISRCNNPKHPNYKWYGDRKISVCKSWINSINNFIKDIGLRPTLKHSLERIDNNKNYNKSNCKWATYYEQSRNRRSNNLITFNKITKCVSDWALDIKISSSALSKRLTKMSVEKALTTPKIPRGYTYKSFKQKIKN